MMPLIHDTFRKMDRDGNSMITINKFREILCRFGFILSDHDSLSLMQLFDSNQNGQISYQEFCDMIYNEVEASTNDSSHIPMDEYKQRTSLTIFEKSEEERVKNAVSLLSSSMYSRHGLSNRLMSLLTILDLQIQINLELP